LVTAASGRASETSVVPSSSVPVVGQGISCRVGGPDVAVGRNVIEIEMGELRFPQQGDEIVLARIRARHVHQRFDQSVDFARLDAGQERDRAHAIAVERQREVVVARARRIERVLAEQHVVGVETEGQRAVLFEQAAQGRRELVPEADHGRIVRVVEPARLQRAGELADDRGGRAGRIRGALRRFGRCLVRLRAVCHVHSGASGPRPTPKERFRLVIGLREKTLERKPPGGARHQAPKPYGGGRAGAKS